jgi:hypothetical protein
VRLEELGKLKKSNDLMENRNRDLSDCSIVPQPTTLPRATLGEHCSSKNMGPSISPPKKKEIAIFSKTAVTTSIKLQNFTETISMNETAEAMYSGK